MSENHTSGLDLEQYRRVNGWSYEALRAQLSLSDRASARDYAVGIKWPRPGTLQCILRKCGGRVTMDAMFARHCAYLESVGKLAASKELATVE